MERKTTILSPKDNNKYYKLLINLALILLFRGIFGKDFLCLFGLKNSIINILYNAIPIICIIIFSCYLYYSNNLNTNIKNKNNKKICAKIQEIWISEGNILMFSAKQGNKSYICNGIILEKEPNSKNFITQKRILPKFIYKQYKIINNLSGICKKLFTILFIPLIIGIVFQIFPKILKILTDFEISILSKLTIFIILVVTVLFIILLIKLTINYIKKIPKNLRNIQEIENNDNQTLRLKEYGKCCINGHIIKIGDYVDIYIDPNNPKNYWINTDFLYK